MAMFKGFWGHSVEPGGGGGGGQLLIQGDWGFDLLLIMFLCDI